ncbi:MAG: multicopper oxidase domain-containing protein [Myxococcota bacterium]
MSRALTLACALGGLVASAGCGDDAREPPHEPAVARDQDPADDVVHVALRAAPADVVIAGERVQALAFNGQVPGPTLRAEVGDTLVVDIDDAMDLPTTVHWHGVHVPWAMDGVTWQSAPIAPGARFTARFVLDRPGTYWYHPHFDSAREVDRGLYGALIVTSPDEPARGRRAGAGLRNLGRGGRRRQRHPERRHGRPRSRQRRRRPHAPLDRQWP